VHSISGPICTHAIYLSCLRRAISQSLPHLPDFPMVLVLQAFCLWDPSYLFGNVTFYFDDSRVHTQYAPQDLKPPWILSRCQRRVSPLRELLTVTLPGSRLSGSHAEALPLPPLWHREIWRRSACCLVLTSGLSFHNLSYQVHFDHSACRMTPI
jgi:hypothetical protein